MRHRFVLLAFGPLLLTVNSFSAIRDNTKSADSRTIDARQYCATVSNTSKVSKKHIFADVAEAEVPKWEKFANDTSLSNALGERTPSAVALVWFRNGKIVEANFSFQSESNDWAKYSDHCFRPDGTLALVRSTLKTFHGSASEITLSIYDKRGSVIKTTVEYRDLNTGRPARRPDDFQEEKTPVYTKTSDLPFIGLVDDIPGHIGP